MTVTMEGVLRKRETRAVTSNIRWARKYVLCDSSHIGYYAQTSRKEVSRGTTTRAKFPAHRTPP